MEQVWCGAMFGTESLILLFTICVCRLTTVVSVAVTPSLKQLPLLPLTGCCLDLNDTRWVLFNTCCIKTGVSRSHKIRLINWYSGDLAEWTQDRLQLSTGSLFFPGCVWVKLITFFLQGLQGTSWWSEFAFEKLLLGLAKEVTRFPDIRSFAWLLSLIRCNHDREVVAKRSCGRKGDPPRAYGHHD